MTTNITKAQSTVDRGLANLARAQAKRLQDPRLGEPLTVTAVSTAR
jgi:hypothetical protein